MSILFNGYQVCGFDTISEEETVERMIESREKGDAPRPLSFDEFFKMTAEEHNALKGCKIEINSKYSVDDITKMTLSGKLESITNLNMATNPPSYDKIYGKMWRVWVNGFPSQELMDATPWEE